MLQKASNGFDRVAILEFDSERMLCQRDTGLLLIRLQGRFEKGLKASGLRLVGHIASTEEQDTLGARLVNCEEMTAREQGNGGSSLPHRWLTNLIRTIDNRVK